MKPGEITPKTAANLETLYALYVEHYTPPFYETPSTHEAAAVMQCDHKEIMRRIKILEKQGRVIVSGKGRVVPDTIRSILQAVPTSEQTNGGHQWLDHRE